MKIDVKLFEKCSDAKLKKVLERLVELEKYCLLQKGDISTYADVFDTIGKMPNQLKEWLKVFDGGYLFSESMFFSNKYKDETLTFAKMNSPEFKKELGIDEDVICFGRTNYGAYYCFAQDEDIDVIYEWDCEEGGPVLKWDTFADWLNERIDDALELLKEGSLLEIEG